LLSALPGLPPARPPRDIRVHPGGRRCRVRGVVSPRPPGALARAAAALAAVGFGQRVDDAVRPGDRVVHVYPAGPDAGLGAPGRLARSATAARPGRPGGERRPVRGGTACELVPPRARVPRVRPAPASRAAAAVRRAGAGTAARPRPQPRPPAKVRA